MLVLSRKEGERVRIGEDVWITVVGIRGGKVRLGFDGPDHVAIQREEVYRRLEGDAPDRLTPGRQADLSSA